MSKKIKTLSKDTSVEAFLNAIDSARKLIKITDPDFGKYYDNEPDEDRERLDILDILYFSKDYKTPSIPAELIKQNFDLEVVEVFGGDEGDGENHFYVTRMGKKYFKLPACYNSYDASIYYWEDVYEVKPKRKTVIIFEAV